MGVEYEWESAPNEDYPARWYFRRVGGPFKGGLRVIRTPYAWQIRFGDGDTEAIQETHPRHLELEEIQALAVLWWRTR